MTEIQCDCGKFKAQLTGFPKNTPGRCICYCDDCQTFANYLNRPDLLDLAGGSEIIPVYPSEFKVLQGKELLACVRLSPKGLFRWYTSCCKTPVGNNQPKFPWVGTLNQIYKAANGADYLEKTLGPIKSRIMGKFAKGGPPEGVAEKMTFKDAMVVLPFLLRGFLTRKAKDSVFFQEDQITPIVQPHIMTLEERNQIRDKIGFEKI